MDDKKRNQMIREVIQEKDEQKRGKMYTEYVEKVTPKHNPMINICYAFFVGGVICVLAQALTALFMSFSVSKETSALYVILVLVFLAALLTGLNIYQKLTKRAGAGSVVPITGFANSVAASAIEFRKEGQVFGVGCRIFTIAGPVILYGILASWVLGLIYFVYTLF